MKQEGEAASVRAREKRRAREGEIRGVSGKLIESKSSRANLPGTLPNRSPFPPSHPLLPPIYRSRCSSLPRTQRRAKFFRSVLRSRTSMSYVRVNALNGRENGLTARCDCVDEFFCRSSIAFRWHAESTAERFWGDNASGRCRFWTMSENQEYSRKPVLFGGLETAVSCISRSYAFKHPRWMRANPGRLSEISKSITNA